MSASPAKSNFGGTFTATSALEASRLPLPVSMLEQLAGRFREAGLFTFAIDAGGGIVWHDRESDAFFLRYALAAFPLENPSRLDRTAGAAAQALPGVVLAAVPCLEKRHAPGTLVLVGRAKFSERDEDLLRLCNRLEIDPGWLASQAKGLPVFDESRCRPYARFLLEMVQDQVRAGALERELNSITTQLANSYEELSLIYQVSSGMKVDRRPDEFFNQACVEVMGVIGTRAMGFALDMDYPGRPDPALYGDLKLSPEQIKRLSADLINALRARGTPLLINNLRNDPRFNWLVPDAANLLAVPLHREQKLLGCLFALDKLEGDFDSVDSKLVHSIANESAIYLENARLFDDVHGLMMGLLHSLTSAVDAKDTYTCGHSERVALLSRNLAREAGLGDEEVEQIYMAGLLHDVGKIGVPEAVLQKTGRLTDEEFELMKKHPQIGARILQDVPQLRAVIPGVLHHHERWDGSGYPFKLSGAAIPVMGRIICLADSFDAMTSNRTYRAARPFEAALEEIAACAGKHFDPGLAEAFLRTGAEGYCELLRDHQHKSRKLLEPRDSRRREPPIVHAAPLAG